MATTIPEASVDAHKLSERLAQVAVGETVTYDELSAVIGRDVRSPRGRGVLMTARRMVHRMHSAVFLPVRTVGLRSVPDEVKCTVGADMRPLRRLSRRKARVLGAVRDYAALPPDAQRRHNVALAIFGTLDLVTKPSEVRRLDAAVMIQQRRLSVGETLSLFVSRSMM